MSQVCIRGVGSYMPSARLTNADVAERFGITEEHIVRLTGIRERRRAAPEEATSDMAVNAARAALVDAGLAPDAVECVIVATASPDHLTPSTANLVQQALQLPTVPAYDLNAGCTGSLYALITATGLARAGVCGTALVIGAELVSRMVNDDDQETALVFGDGAGALVLQSGEGVSGDLRVLAHSWASDGSLSEVIKVPAGGSRRPASHQTVDAGEHYLRMNGGRVFRFAVRALTSLVHDVLERAGRTLADLRLLIPHQANLRIIEAAAKKLPLDTANIMVNIDRYGNTSAASVIVALHEAREQGRLQSGDTVVMASFGAGLTWAARRIGSGVEAGRRREENNVARYAGIMSGELSERPRELLTQYRRIAMVGVSGNPTRASYRALVHMKSQAYTVYPVNPAYDEILGLKCYDSLLDIKEPVDIVDIFRRPEMVLPLVSEAREIGAKVFWMQIGVINEEAAAQARAAGMEVIMDRCVKIEHCRFYGKKDFGLDVVGLQTGITTADRFDCVFDKQGRVKAPGKQKD